MQMPHLILIASLALILGVPAAGAATNLASLTSAPDISTLETHPAEALLIKAQKNALAAEQALQAARAQLKPLPPLEGNLNKEKKLHKQALSQTSLLGAATKKIQKEGAQLEANLIKLKQQITLANQDAQTWQNLRDEYEKTKALRQESQSQIQAMTAERQAMESKISDLQNKLQYADKQLAALTKPDQATQRVKRELEKEKHRRTQLIDQAAQIASRRDLAEKEISRLKNQLADIENKIVSQAPTNSAAQLKADLAQAKKQREQAEIDLQKASQTAALAEKKCAALQKDVAGAKTRLQPLTQKLAQLKSLQIDLEKEQHLQAEAQAAFRRHQESQAATLKEIAALNDKLAEAQTQDKENQRLIQSVAQVRKELEQAKKSQDVWLSKAEEATAAAEKTEKELLLVKTQWDNLAKRLADATNAPQFLARQQLQTALAQATAQRQEAEIKVQQTEKDHQTKIALIADLRRQIVEVEKRLAKDQKQVLALEKLQADLKQEQKVRLAAAAKIEQRTQQIAALEKENAELQARIGAAEQRQEQQAQQIKTSQTLREQLANEKVLQQATLKKSQTLDREWQRQEKRQSELATALRKAENRIAQLASSTEQPTQIQIELERAKLARQQTAAQAQVETNAQARLAAELNWLTQKSQSLSEQLALLNQPNEALRRAQQDLAQTHQHQAALEAQLQKENAARQAAEDRLKTLSLQMAQLPRPAQAAASTLAPAAEDGGLRAIEQRIIAEGRVYEGQVGETPPRSASQALLAADQAYQAGIQKWDGGDIDGAIIEFKKTVAMNPQAAGAYYNLGLAYLRKHDSANACDYAYQAGRLYLKKNNTPQALRMVILMKNADASSPLIEKLRQEIANESK